MNLFKQVIVNVDGFRFKLGDTIWFMYDDSVESADVIGRAFCEGKATPWWEDFRGATYFVLDEEGDPMVIRGRRAFATKEELIENL